MLQDLVSEDDPSGTGEMFNNGTNNNNPSKAERLQRDESIDSEWTTDSLDASQDSEVFVSSISSWTESAARAREHFQSRGRRRIVSDISSDKRSHTRGSTVLSSDAYSSLSSSLSYNDSSGGAYSVSQWVEAAAGSGDNVFDATLVAGPDQMLPEGASLKYPSSRAATVSSGSEPELLASTLVQDQFSKSLNNDKPALDRSLSNADLIQIASSMAPSISARKREQFRRGESWNGSSIDSELSVVSVTSVDDLLDVVNDPEELLLNLGFGVSTADPLDRIPKRFLERESSAEGITREKFLQQVRDREKGYDFCLTGGLRGLERFLNTQLVNSGFNISPSDSPQFGSPVHEPLPSFTDPSQSSHFSNGNGDFSGQRVFQPSATNPSSNRRGYLSRNASKESLLSTDDSIISESTNYDSDFSNSGDWSDTNFDAGRTKLKGKKLTAAISNLDTVEEELESQLRARSPCPPSPRPPSLPSPGAASKDPVSSAPYPWTNLAPPSNHTPPLEGPGQMAVEEDWIRSSSGQEELASVTPSDARVGDFRFSPMKNNFSALEDAIQDSFEIEEICGSDEQQTQNGNDARGILSRNESQQSDSSGFADEGVESTSPASPQHEGAMDTTPQDLTKIDQGQAYAEPNNNLDISAACARANDTDSAQEQSMRPRSGTFPSVANRSSSTSQPRTVPEILESLQKNYKKAEKAKTMGAGEKRRKLFSKMDTVDPEEYSFSGGREKEGEDWSGTEDGVFQEGGCQVGVREISAIVEGLEKASLASRLEGDMVPQKVELGTDGELGPHGLGKRTAEGIDELGSISNSLTTDDSTSERTVVEKMPNSTDTKECTSTHERARKVHEIADSERREGLLKRLDSEDICDRLRVEQEDSEETTMAQQLAEREPEIIPDSPDAREIEAQRELQDLKLMQRALIKYKQELWELDEWSAQINERSDGTVEGNEHIAKELASLKSLRQKVKNEVEKMEASLQEQMKEIISNRGALDRLSHRFAHWSYSHIDVLNKMVSLMKEQESLRKHLAEIRAENSRSSEKRGCLPSPIASGNIYQTLTKNDLIQELVNTQLELARLKVMSRTEMTAAISEMKKCIVSDIRREVDHELRVMQWQIKDRDDQIEQLKMLIQRQNNNAEETGVDSSGDQSPKVLPETLPDESGEELAADQGPAQTTAGSFAETSITTEEQSTS